MSLPDSWVDRIFTRLLVRYGAAWIRMWDGVPMDAVKADWANELDGLRGDSLTHALEHLPPEKPPTVTQFKSLALGKSEPVLKLPPMAPASREVVERVLQGLALGQQENPKGWAIALREREQNGHKLSRFQRECWRAALEAAC